MNKPEICNYTYDYFRFGYEIRYNGILIDGLSTIPTFIKDFNDRRWTEYHMQQAQKRLKEILKSKGLWQNKVQQKS